MTDDFGAFRHAAGRFASGVTVVTVAGPDGAYGITVSSFASLSLNPLLVSVSINRDSVLVDYVRNAGAYAVSVLSSGQQDVAAYFARKGREPEPGGFSSVPTDTYRTGTPVVRDALSWFDCTVEDLLPGGDHVILVGRVAAAGGGTGEPLVYWAGDYRALHSAQDHGAADDRLANAADGLAVAVHMLDVDPVEMLDAQNSVEPAMAALAAQRGRAADWDRLTDLVDRSVAVVDDPEAFNQLALEFHAELAALSGNRILQATLTSLKLVQAGLYRQRGSRATADAAIESHRRLLVVLRQGDPDAARAEMLDHLAGVRQRLQPDGQ